MKIFTIIAWLAYAWCLGAFEHVLHHNYHFPTDLMIYSWIMLFIIGYFGYISAYHAISAEKRNV